MTKLIQIISAFLILLFLPGNRVVNNPAPGGGSGQNFSDDFTSDPTSTWTGLFGSMSWGGGVYSTGGGGGGNTAYNIDTDTITQYAKVTLVDAYGGLVFRSTGTASDGFWQVTVAVGSVYLSRYDDGGWLDDEDNATFATSPSDTVSTTCEGTGTGTTFRIWLNTANNTPSAVDGWDSGGDTPDATITAAGSAVFYDTGLRVGLGLDVSGYDFDNWFGGDVP